MITLFIYSALYLISFTYLLTLAKWYNQKTKTNVSQLQWVITCATFSLLLFGVLMIIEGIYRWVVREVK